MQWSGGRRARSAYGQNGRQKALSALSREPTAMKQLRGMGVLQ